MASSPTILIAYDGTERARYALSQAARFLKPRSVELITAWEPVEHQAARALGRSGLPQASGERWRDEGGDDVRTHAETVLEDGLELAENLGLSARAHLVETTSTTSQAIVEAAKELDVDVIVLGTRGLSGVKSWFNTSTAETVMHNAGLPVFIVPLAAGNDASASSTPLSAF